MTTKGEKVRVSAYKCGGYDIPESLVDFVTWAQARLSDVPKQHQGDAKITVDCMFEGSCEIEIYYWRNASEEEKAQLNAEREAERLKEVARLRAALDALERKRSS